MSNTAGQLLIGPSHVEFKNVPIVAPTGADRGGEVLIKSLNFRVEQGEHVLITGAK